MLKKILGNVQEGSRECSKRFREIFQKKSRNAQKDSVEFLKRFQRMFLKNPGKCSKDFAGEHSKKFQ